VNSRQPEPGPDRDFRALADLLPQQGLELFASELVKAPTTEDHDVELSLRSDVLTGSRVTLIASATFSTVEAVRSLADSLDEIADALAEHEQSCRGRTALC